MSQSDSKRRDSQESLSLSVKDRIQVTIEKMAVGGAALARYHGVVIFIYGGAPGDVLDVEITLKKKNYLEAKILKIVSEGPERRMPPCPIAGRCGGCSWQHLSEKEQLHQKWMIVQDNFNKFLPGVPFEVLPVISSPRDYRYRNRIQPKYDAKNFGFFAQGSHTIIPITDCLISEEMITEKFSEIAQQARSKKPEGRIEIYIDQDDQKVKWSFIDGDDDGVGFSQVNRFQNEQMLSFSMGLADGKYSEIWDLYAGSGNFTFPIAKKFSEASITAVELSAKLVQRGRQLNSSKKLNFHQSDVESFLRRHTPAPHSLVIVDPPRGGCTQYVMESLALSRPTKIIYISCHPTSLVRDLQWFFKAASGAGLNYSIKTIQPFDMFPQTDHIETVVEVMIDSSL